MKIVPAFLLFTNLSEIRYKKKSPWKHITKWLVKKKNCSCESKIFQVLIKHKNAPSSESLTIL